MSECGFKYEKHNEHIVMSILTPIYLKTVNVAILPVTFVELAVLS